MEKPKIYISKSKVGNPDDLMNLRSLLKSWDCEVTEFFGGAYNSYHLDQADILLVVPPYIGCINSTDVSKGQHEEVNRFIKYQKGIANKAYMVTHIANNEVIFEQIRVSIAYHFDVSNYQDKFGYISVVDECPWELYDVMDSKNIIWLGNKKNDSNTNLLLTVTPKSSKL